MNRTIVLAALAAGTVTGTAAAQGGVVNTTLVGRWNGFPGSYADVWGDGDFAYVAHLGSSSVDIVDIADPANPERVVHYFLPPPNEGSSAQDVKVGDGLLFIGLDASGNSAHIVDVRDPRNPVGLVDVAIDGLDDIHNLFYHEGYLYLVDSRSPRVGIVDLTDFDPDAPPPDPITETKWMVTDVGSDKVHDVTVVGDRMYASAWDGGVWIYDVASIATDPPAHLGDGPGNNTHSCWPTDDGRYVITGEERGGGGITVYRIDEGEGGSVTLVITDAIAFSEKDTFSVHNQVAVGNRVYNSWYGVGMQVYDVIPGTGLLEFAASYNTEETSSTWGVYPLLGPERVLLSDISSGLFIVAVDAPLPCLADLDASGTVDTADLVALLAAWGSCVGCPADIDGSGTVDTADLVALLAAWGPCPG